MSKSGTYNFQEVSLKGGRYVLLFLLSAGSNVNEKAVTPIAILDHQVNPCTAEQQHDTMINHNSPRLLLEFVTSREMKSIMLKSLLFGCNQI